MTLHLVREPSVRGATLGRLFVNGDFAAYTLEDEIREQLGIHVAAWKIKGATAIPAGTYRVAITPSKRFHRLLPQLLDVPGFEGIRIHPGNVAADTEGCILVGFNRTEDRITDSRKAFDALFQRLVDVDAPITITIENPPGQEIPEAAREIRQA